MSYLSICFIVLLLFLQGCFTIRTGILKKDLSEGDAFNFSQFTILEKKKILMKLQEKNNVDEEVIEGLLFFLKSTLIESDDDIRLEALKVTIKIWHKDLKKECINQTKTDFGLLRLHAFMCLFPNDGEIRLPWSSEVISLLENGLKDHDWIVQDYILNVIFHYLEEKEEKKLFFPVLFLLKSQNLDVLRSTYRVINWYGDQRTLPLLYKRLSYALSDLEVVLIIRELSHHKDRRTLLILERLRKKTKSLLVRSELDRVFMK